MGAFFSLMSVYLGHSETVERLLDVYAADMAASGSRLVADASEATRCVVIGLPTATTWSTIRDNAYEGGGSDTLHRSADLVASRLARPVVTVIVHDSDVLFLGLHRPDAPAIVYCNDPGYFDGSSSGDPPPFPAAEWRAIFPSPPALDAWLRKLDDPPLLIERLVDSLGECLGWDAALIGAGDVDEFLQGSARRVLYVSDRPEAQQTASGADAQPPPSSSAPPVLYLTSWSGGFEAIQGTRWECNFSIASQWGRARGIRIILWGPAVDDGLLGAPFVSLRIPQLPPAETRFPFQEHTHEQHRRLWVVDLPDVHLEAGSDPSSSGRGLLADSRSPVRGAVAARALHNLTLMLDGCGTVPGTGSWSVAIQPFENRSDGAARFDAVATIVPTPWRPARSTIDADYYLIALSQSSVLNALMVLDPDRPLDEHWLLESLRSWWAVIAPHLAAPATLLVHAAGKKRPTSRDVPIDKAMSGSAWSMIVKHAPNAHHLVLGAELADQGEAGSVADAGWSLDRGRPDDGDGLAPHLILWMDQRRLDPAQRQQVTATLVAIVDRFMNGGGGLQATLSAWHRQLHPTSTPYEDAIGLSSDGCITQHADWCRQRIRAVPNLALWLGSALAERCGQVHWDPSRFHVTSLGPSLKLELRDGSSRTLSDFEQALTPVLPTPEAQEPFLERYHDRLLARHRAAGVIPEDERKPDREGR